MADRTLMPGLEAILSHLSLLWARNFAAVNAAWAIFCLIF